MSQLIVVADIAGAMVLGGLIGFKRELAQRPAGFLVLFALSSIEHRLQPSRPRGRDDPVGGQSPAF